MRTCQTLVFFAPLFFLPLDVFSTADLYEQHTKNWSKTTGGTGNTGKETLLIYLRRSAPCAPCPRGLLCLKLNPHLGVLSI